MVESIIAIGLLATVGALAVMLGKLQIASQANFDASHALAFECAILPQRCVKPRVTAAANTSDRIRRDHFTQNEAGLVQVAAWTDRAGRPMLDAVTDAKMTLTHPHFGAGTGVARLGSGVRVLSKLVGPNRFGLDITGGFVTSTVQLDLMQDAGQSNTPDLLNRTPLSFTAKSAILTDHWNASHPYGTASTSVQVRVDKGKQLSKAVETGFRIAYAPTRASMLFMWGLLLESDARKFKYHDVDMDLIPLDRLGR